jgi:hypothetical protein
MSGASVLLHCGDVCLIVDDKLSDSDGGGLPEISDDDGDLVE